MSKRKGIHILRISLACVFAGIILLYSGVLIANVVAHHISFVQLSKQRATIETNSPRNVQDREWYLLLVNSEHSIPDGYEIELTVLSNGQSVDARIYPALQEMFDTMRAQGIYPVVTSGYRTSEKQQSLMDEKVQEFVDQGYSKSKSRRMAREWVAVPGTSEHELGLAVDINNDYTKSSADEVYNWLAENAYLYGFILRYPADKYEITRTAYEPWHYRYVGIDAAKEIHSRGICLEEYLEGMDANNG